MIEKMIQGWMKMQQQALPGISELQREFMEGMEKMKSGFDPAKSQKLMENGIKFQRAFVAQQQALLEMMEAISDNSKILSGDK